MHQKWLKRYITQSHLNVQKVLVIASIIPTLYECHCLCDYALPHSIVIGALKIAFNRENEEKNGTG